MKGERNTLEEWRRASDQSHIESSNKISNYHVDKEWTWTDTLLFLVLGCSLVWWAITALPPAL